MHVVIPAAGLGTRLRPLTDACPKEMLPLGGRPAIDAALLEVAAASATATVVVSPGKADLAAHVAHRAPGVTFATQDAPRGTLDAVDRGRRGDRYAVLYPDYVYLPDQTGLSRLLAAAATVPDATWFAATRRDSTRMGRSARVELADLGDGRARVTAVDGAEGEWHTVFAEVRGPAHQALLDAGPLDDARLLPILAALAARGLLYVLQLPGPVLDLGVMAGYRDAVARFDAGRARWRGDP
ncbi:MAG: NTP transferase domain-containing protein [Myxococcales bacterium]|nr:NTP transferase domain-containing protein [Myxococcales bacterium]